MKQWALAVLVAVTAACGSVPASGPGPEGRGCSSADLPARAGGTGSGGGSATMTPHTAPPLRPPSPSSPTPTPSNGLLMLTAADDRRTVSVPGGTIIEVRLEPEHGTAWTVPQSSDRIALPRVAASDRCDPVAAATFQAVGPGEITASRPYGDAVRQFRVSVRIAA